MKKLLRLNHGFTIIELIVVLAILAGVVAMLSKGVGSGAEAAKVNQARVDMNGSVRTAILSYAATLDKVADFNDDTAKKYWPDIKDPWGEEYQFTRDSKKEPGIVKINAGQKGQAAGVKEIAVDLSKFIY